MLASDPGKHLRPFVRAIWASSRPVSAAVREEKTLPDGYGNIVIRLDGSQLEMEVGQTRRSIPSAVVSGIHTQAIKKYKNCSASVGASLRPGALAMLQGGAVNFTNDNVPLESVLPETRVQSLRQQLVDAPTPAQQVALLRAFLTDIFASASLHPMVRYGLQNLAHDTQISELVKGSGLSHRYFNQLFSRSVGVTPKTYQRLLRLQRCLRLINADAHRSWIELAQESGFADQSHLNREFRLLAGMTPATYADSERRAAVHIIT